MIELAFLIPTFPLVGFLILAFFGKRIGDPKAGYVGTAAVTLSFLATLIVWLGVLTHNGLLRQHTQVLFDWITVGELHVRAALLIDQLSVTMALFVTGVSALIHLYSVGYMKKDPRYHQFFVYLNLFVFSMLILVLGDNFLMLFLGWEGVGASSYLLIGFWFERSSAATAAKKAFVMNRIGDAGLLLGMFLIFHELGTWDFYGEGGTGVLDRLNEIPGGTITAIALLLFVGAVGKSAQLPLYTWLPDAMEGPTPVSALIHAATMVTAGVYLMARIAPMLELSDVAANTVAIVGASTALFAATIACAQNDIKRVLAYSTMSQLGYMFLAVGSGAYAFGLFHMVTHAFFKALLFLSAGSVIHALADEQDLKKMGNLRKYLPWTALCFGVGWLALAGIFPFAGFWSKDEILLAAYEKNIWLWGVGAVTVLLTAYYMSRLFFLAFFGNEHWRKANSSKKEAAAHSHELHGEPHEAPWSMRAPLVILAVASAIAGFLNVSFGPFREVFSNFLAPVDGLGIEHEHIETATKVNLAGISLGLALLGILIAFLVFKRSPLWPEALEPKVLVRCWFVDPLYSLLFEKPGLLLARFSSAIVDKQVIDGAVNGTAKGTALVGAGLRKVQTGYVRNYALSIAIGTSLVLAWALVRSGS